MTALCSTCSTRSSGPPASPAHDGQPLQQGQCVQIASDDTACAAPKDDQLYQVISIDDRHNRCWVRRWPLARNGSEVFEISLQQVRPSRPHRP